MQLKPDDTPTPQVRHIPVVDRQPDLRWMPDTQEEMAVLAHIRGWCHLGTICEICRVQREHELDRATLESIIKGS